MSSILTFHSYVKFLTCQVKPSNGFQGLWSIVRVRNTGFRQDFWENKKMRKIGGLVHGAPKGCYGRVKTFVKWHKAYAIWIMLRNIVRGGKRGHAGLCG